MSVKVPVNLCVLSLALVAVSLLVQYQQGRIRLVLLITKPD